MAPQQAYQLYRNGLAGSCLIEALEEMGEQIDVEQAFQLVMRFDQAMNQALEENVKGRCTLAGKLDSYRFCDNVWDIVAKDVTIKVASDRTVKVDEVKFVANDGARKAQ